MVVVSFDTPTPLLCLNLPLCHSHPCSCQTSALRDSDTLGLFPGNPEGCFLEEAAMHQQKEWCFLDWRWCVCGGGISTKKIGHERWCPRDLEPRWASMFKQELLAWPLYLGDREVRFWKPTSPQKIKKNKKKSASEKCCLLANVQSTGTGGGGVKSQRKSDSPGSVSSSFQPV